MTQDENHTLAVYPVNSEGKEGCWRWGMPKASAAIMNDSAEESDVVARQKRGGGWNVYEKNRRSTTKVKSIWDETEMRTEEGTRLVRGLFNETYFDHPKPLALVRRCVEIGTNPGDIVLDFFAGSSTTAHAVMELNFDDRGRRTFIEVQLPEPTPEGSLARDAGFETIPEISRRRIELASEWITGDKEGQLNVHSSQIDSGFRAFKLADTNFSKWRSNSDVDAHELEQQLLNLADSADDDATPDDLLTEILLKQGFSLTERIEPQQVAGLEIRVVLQSDGDPAVLAYLDEHVKPSLDQLREMVAAIPGGKIIVLEDAFQGDDELKTNLAQMCKTNNIELWTA